MAHAKLTARLEAVGGSPIVLLRVLLAATLVVPALLFVIVSWLNYGAIVRDARQDLQRVSDVAREHAAKTFEGQSQVVERVNDLMRGLTEAEVTAEQEHLHQAMDAIIAHLPQVQSVLLASRSGRPLVSASVYPVPALVDLRGTDYFKAVMDGFEGTYVTSLQVGSVLRHKFFGLAGPWRDSSGAVNGVIDVAVSPTFFQDFYRALIGEDRDTSGMVLTLVRADGQILVRYPPFAGPPPKVSGSNAFFDAITANPVGGTYSNRSIVDPDAPYRLFAYRRVEGYPLYVAAGRSWDVLMQQWHRTMVDHLLFGIPTTAVLFLITRTALVRTRREAEALALARDEMRRRQDAEDALLRAQRLEAVGQMTGGVAHDFNNLLTVITGNAELIARKTTDTDARRLAANIGLAARRGADITQKLLAFSGRQMIRPETVNLNRRLAEFKPLLDRAASQAVRVTLDLDPGLDPVRLDPGQFEAAILNLVGNARDAMDGGKVAIRTRNLTQTDDEDDLPAGRYVRIEVTDSGSGMAPETAARAFEPFFTTKEVGRGTGLGLSQVYGFARQAGGTARITTGPNQGTTIALILPRSADAPAERPSADIVPIRSAASGEVVLVVEDDASVQSMAVECLQGLGYTALTAPDAPAALERLRSGERVDVLFSDIVMPGGMNGAQLAVEAMRLRPALKVLMTSGYAGTRPSLPEGVPLLLKPYDSGQLGRQLQAVLGGRR
jgi:two-component system NtrC family sensor kinase